MPLRARTFWGESMRVRLPEALSQQLLASRFFEEGLTVFLLEHLRPGATFFDIGAHLGYFSMLGSKLVGVTGRVHAFEPTPTTLSALTANTASRTNVTVVNAAVWDAAAELTFSDFGPAASMFNSLRDSRINGEAAPTSHREIRVAAISLDAYVELTGAVPSFIKIDAESAEREVLRGAQQTIRKHRPVITIEVGDFDIPGAAESRELVDSIIAAGYTPYEYSGGRVTPHRPRERYGYDNLLFLPDVDAKN